MFYSANARIHGGPWEGYTVGVFRDLDGLGVGFNTGSLTSIERATMFADWLASHDGQQAVRNFFEGATGTTQPTINKYK